MGFGYVRACDQRRGRMVPGDVSVPSLASASCSQCLGTPTSQGQDPLAHCTTCLGTGNTQQQQSQKSQTPQALLHHLQFSKRFATCCPCCQRTVLSAAGLAEVLGPFLFLFMLFSVTTGHLVVFVPYLISLPTEEPWSPLLSGAFQADGYRTAHLVAERK